MAHSPHTIVIRRVRVSSARPPRTLLSGDVVNAPPTRSPASVSIARPPSETPDPGTDVLTAEGVVTDLSPTSITVRDLRGVSRTYARSASTMVRRDGAAVDAAQLRRDQRIAIVATPDHSATTVVILPPVSGSAATAEGVVTDLSPTSITVRDPRGVSRTYARSASTSLRGDADLAPTDVAIGEHVSVETVPGEPDAAGAIAVEPALVTGTIVDVTGDTLTVADHQGFYRPVRVSPTATLTSAGTPAALADVTVGTTVVAAGYVDTTHTVLDAATLDLQDQANDRS